MRCASRARQLDLARGALSLAAFAVAVSTAGCSAAPRNYLGNGPPVRPVANLVERCDLQSSATAVPRTSWRSRANRSVIVPGNAAYAIRVASRLTGMHSDYLALTAARESNFSATAQARSSSAAGMFQFIDQTWLAAFHRDGACLGFRRLARKIKRAPSGKYYVDSLRAKRRIFALRKDPVISAILAARLAQDNSRILSSKLRRSPSFGELYTAHFLGPRNAVRLLQLARTRPDAPAKRYFAQAARSNPRIFHDGRRPRSLLEVVKVLTKSHDNSRVFYTI